MNIQHTVNKLDKIAETESDNVLLARLSLAAKVQGVMMNKNSFCIYFDTNFSCYIDLEKKVARK